MRLKIVICVVIALSLIISVTAIHTTAPKIDNNEVESSTTVSPPVSTVPPSNSEEVIPDVTEPPETIVPEEIKPTVKPNLPPILETVPPLVEPEVLPDIITLEVKLYDEHNNDYNLIDGRKYIEDIISYLKLYAPEGMFYSAASAMAYTEGGSGKRGVYTATNNCFGIRAYSSWNGYVYARSTGKVYKDYQTAVKYGASDFFRAYDSMEDSVKDYIKLISRNYYCAALETETPADYLAYVLSKGYGEAELYNMWLGVINIYDLTQYDVE